MNKKNERFLLISPDFPPPLVGGSLVWLLNLVSNCPEEFDVLTGPKNKEYVEVFESPNRVFRSKFIKDSHDPTKLQLLFTYLYMPIWMVRHNFKEKYSAVLVNPGVIGNSILFLVGKLFGIKVIGIGHGEEITVPLYGKGLKNFIKRSIMKFSYKHAVGFIVVCHFCKRLLESIEVNGEFVDVIPSCLNPDKIGKRRANPKNNHNIISVGRLIERKGFHFLIDAVVELKKQFPEIRLEIVGNGPYKNTLEKKIKDTQSSSYINLNGEISDDILVNLYENSAIAVLAHTLLKNGDTEGCPTVFSEAMGHGLPVIGGDGAGADTAIVDGKNGFIVHSPNIGELIDAISTIFLKPDLAQSMSEYGRKKLQRDHDPKKNGLAMQGSLHRFIENSLAEGHQKDFNERPGKIE